MGDPLPAVPLPGIRPDSLGRYLTALGLLRVATRKWPQVRGTWRDGYFWLVGGPAKVNALIAHVSDFGQKNEWTPYERAWKKELEQEKKRKLGEPSQLSMQQSETGEALALLSVAHSVATEISPGSKQPSSWRFFNPLMGLGGSVGRRDFMKGWSEAREAIRLAQKHTELEKARKDKKTKKSKIEKLQKELDDASVIMREDLEAYFGGQACRYLGSWNAASWFSEANKVANCGQDWFGGGQVTPWAMLLACEGIPFFAGSPSRRLGSRARSVGAFPFVTRPAAPERENEAGRDRAEVWLPLWSRPMTSAEVRILFLRGRAEVGGAGATTPAAFAAAVVRRGVDAGIDGFQRFVLGRTTTDQVFESRLESFIPLPGPGSGEADLARSQAIESILALCDRLPRDRKKGKRWQFRGLRGPVEASLVAYAAEPADPQRAIALLDAVVASLDKVDRNRNHRKAGVCWRPLPIRWLLDLFGDLLPSVEARLAMGFASIGLGDSAMMVHRYGVRLDRYRREFVFPDAAPHRRTWGNRPFPGNLAAIIHRRLVDADPTAPLPLWPSVRTSLGDVSAWLSGRVDDREVERWFSRLVLFGWRDVPDTISALARGERGNAASASLALHTLLRPLFEPGRLWLAPNVELLASRTGARSVGAARQIASLLTMQDVGGAVRVARSRYHVACQPLARINAPLALADPDRLLASLLIPTMPGELIRMTRSWLRPTRSKGVAQ
jgi:CRISPR-associated protein Csx17